MSNPPFSEGLPKGLLIFPLLAGLLGGHRLSVFGQSLRARRRKYGEAVNAMGMVVGLGSLLCTLLIFNHG